MTGPATRTDAAAKVDEYVARIADLAGVEKAEAARANALKIGLIGTPEQVVDQLLPWVASGMSYAIAYFPEAAYDTSGLELFASRVAPALQ